MALIGKKAPLFKAPAVVDGGTIVEDFDLADYIGKKYIVLFFYPKDFTFVCPTEIFAFQDRLKEFEKRNAMVIGCSTDTEQCHWAWLNWDRSKGGIKGVTYPLVADTNKTISTNYGVLAGEWDYNEEGELICHGEMVAYRGLFIIDLDGIVRHELINDMPIGRSVDEVLRVLDAIQFVGKYGEVCPADWTPGKEALKPTHEGVAEYLAKYS